MAATIGSTVVAQVDVEGPRRLSAVLLFNRGVVILMAFNDCLCKALDLSSNLLSNLSPYLLSDLRHYLLQLPAHGLWNRTRIAV